METPSMFQLTKKTLVPLAVALMPLTATQANTHTIPELSEPTYMIVGYAPGGASDRAARFVSEQLQDALGVTVLVENKTGAGGRIAAQYTKNQPRERDTLMIGNPAVMVVAPLVFNELNYDPQEDFTAVAEIGRASCREKVEVTACGEAVSGDDRQHESSDGQDRAT